MNSQFFNVFQMFGQRLTLTCRTMFRAMNSKTLGLNELEGALLLFLHLLHITKVWLKTQSYYVCIFS